MGVWVWRVGGFRRANRRAISQTVTTQGNRHRRILHRLAWIMHPTPRRHGPNTRDSSSDNPLTWADFNSSAAPRFNTNCATTVRLLLRSASIYPETEPSRSPFSLAGQALPCITRRHSHHHRLNHEKIEAGVSI